MFAFLAFAINTTVSITNALSVTDGRWFRLLRTDLLTLSGKFLWDIGDTYFGIFIGIVLSLRLATTLSGRRFCYAIIILDTVSTTCSNHQ